MRMCMYAGICGWEIDGYRACGFVISGGLAFNSRLCFSHPMPVGIGYWFYGFFHNLCHLAYGSLRIVGAETLEITEDHGISGWL